MADEMFSKGYDEECGSMTNVATVGSEDFEGVITYQKRKLEGIVGEKVYKQKFKNPLQGSTRGLSTVHYLCTLCSMVLNSIPQLKQHNNGERHAGVLRKLGICPNHDVMDHAVEKRTGLDFMKPNVNHNVHCITLTGKDANAIIEDLRIQNEDIPDGVKMVVKVKKILDFKNFQGSFDFEQCLVNSEKLGGSFVLMEGDDVIGIHIAQGIPHNAATKLCVDAIKLWESGGYVERSKDKHAEPMAMFGYRIAKTFQR